jgi:DNA mismatch endonuclease (patch repair protein)
MPDVFTPAKRSEVMSRIRSHGNAATELRLMKLMRDQRITGWRRQLLLTIREPGIKVRPDFVFRRECVAVFVDGCFWHGCPRHATRPKQNRKFWETKILRNQTRDRLVKRELRKAGWTVLRIWECALTLKRARGTLSRLRRALDKAPV